MNRDTVLATGLGVGLGVGLSLVAASVYDRYKQQPKQLLQVGSSTTASDAKQQIVSAASAATITTAPLPVVPGVYTAVLTASAPGKIILCGEHAVVHGARAVATTCEKRSYAFFTRPIGTSYVGMKRLTACLMQTVRLMSWL